MDPLNELGSLSGGGTSEVNFIPNNFGGHDAPVDSDWAITTDEFVTSITIRYEATAAANANGNQRGPMGVYVTATATDTDGDGVPDHCDIDSDNDGISDLLESGNAVAIAADTDGSGVIDTQEAIAAGFTDADGDGAWDQLGTVAPVDTDGDGVADHLDLDSDNDGIADAVEAQPTVGYATPSIGSDADGDGAVDTFDDPSVAHGAAFDTPVDLSLIHI